MMERTKPIELRELDVVCGRGKGYERFPGNVIFKRLVKRYSAAYSGYTGNRQQKMEIIQQIAEQLRKQDIRFLRRDQNGVWVKLDEDATEMKIAHALRDIRHVRERREKRKKIATDRATSSGPNTDANVKGGNTDASTGHLRSGEGKDPRSLMSSKSTSPASDLTSHSCSSTSTSPTELNNAGEHQNTLEIFLERALTPLAAPSTTSTSTAARLSSSPAEDARQEDPLSWVNAMQSTPTLGTLPPTSNTIPAAFTAPGRLQDCLTSRWDTRQGEDDEFLTSLPISSNDNNAPISGSHDATTHTLGIYGSSSPAQRTTDVSTRMEEDEQLSPLRLSSDNDYDTNTPTASWIAKWFTLDDITDILEACEEESSMEEDAQSEEMHIVQAPESTAPGGVLFGYMSDDIEVIEQNDGDIIFPMISR